MSKRLIAWWKRKEQTEADVFTRWERDSELPPLSEHGLFEEYLELGECQSNDKMFANFYYMSVFSYTVWFHHHLCCCIPTGSIICLAQQRH